MDYCACHDVIPQTSRPQEVHHLCPFPIHVRVGQIDALLEFISQGDFQTCTWSYCLGNNRPKSSSVCSQCCSYSYAEE
jgi:hypothetical protein